MIGGMVAMDIMDTMVAMDIMTKIHLRLIQIIQFSRLVPKVDFY